MDKQIGSKQELIKTHLADCQFITPSYTLYDGLAGFQDYGILGCMVKNKLLTMWRKAFINNNNIYEVETPIITPPSILEASGHLSKFTDLVVYDENNNEFRADHLVKGFIKGLGQDSSIVDTWSKEQIEDYINDKKLIKPSKGLFTDKVHVTHKNLMHKLDSDLFLRPELAQGIFVNFKRYLDFNKGALPFGIGQIGKSFRKEISTQSFLRLREFSQAEIEYFFNPVEPVHNEYLNYVDTVLPLLSRDLQLQMKQAENKSLGEALTDNIINNQIMGVFLAKIYNFAISIGLNKDQIRFRQHLSNEMAHYASDCWDLECFIPDGLTSLEVIPKGLTSSGVIDGDWVECVGCANRQSFDLKNHDRNKQLSLKTEDKVWAVKPINKELGKTFKGDSKLIINYLEHMDEPEIGLMKETHNLVESYIITISDQKYNILPNMVSYIQEYKYIYPHVIEPSFGIDRLMYAVFSQRTWLRPDDEQRIVMSLDKLCPYYIAILPLSNKQALMDVVSTIHTNLKQYYDCYLDNTGVAIGRKYARTDKIGIKHVITVDFDSLNDQMVTIRERDSMSQIRVPICDLHNVISSL
jgi:glycyl-tRNA synthetase